MEPWGPHLSLLAVDTPQGLILGEGAAIAVRGIEPARLQV